MREADPMAAPPQLCGRVAEIGLGASLRAETVMNK